MLGVFVRQGMSQPEAERTGILQLYVFYLSHPSLTYIPGRNN
jgi:hypothetical protein